VRIPPSAADLPVLEALPALDAALAEAGRAVLTAPPGSGKTTLVPLALLDSQWLAGRRILVLEPRRVAARASAARMASLLGERVGQTVGYQVRFDRRIGADTRIEVITEGLLTRRLQADPELAGVGLVIFDEFHERSLDVDLALALALEARATLREDLRLLVMSATLDADAVSKLLDGAPVIRSDGRLHPVEVRYHPQAGNDIALGTAQLVRMALEEGPGDVLAFLPGMREIRAAASALEGSIAARVLPLHGELSAEAQDLALAPLADGGRKVILATNIAQTSLTVEGVQVVVDSGWARVARFDAGAGANRLDTERISRAAAEQRAGRAGRLGPGRCLRLWSLDQQRRLPAHDTPEIQRADLCRFVLELAAWGAVDADALALVDAPPPAAWQRARQLLHELGALDEEYRITPHGRALLQVPAPPRIGDALLRAQEAGGLAEAAWAAALLEQRAPGPVDLVERWRALRRAPQGRLSRRVAEQYLRSLGGKGSIDDASDERAFARAVAWMYPERIATAREGQRGVFICADGGEARLSEQDGLAGAPWLAIAHWLPGEVRRVQLAARLELADLHADFGDRIRDREVIAWEPRTQSVQAERLSQLGALVLRRRPLMQPDADAQQRAMLDGIEQAGIEALPWTAELRQWQARVLSLRAWNGPEWPDVSDAALAAGLEDWLAPYLSGVTRLAHLARLDLGAILRVWLDHAMQQALERLAPQRLVVPSGSSIGLEYSCDGAPPVLAVKLQELFGLRETPRVNQGRVPVLLHLLSPARRPIQVTQDLASFWASGYADVRRDLKGRYPKHPWPDDPMSAPPTARAKPRK
jgi:ATP-dependent helicase HrpB